MRATPHHRNEIEHAKMGGWDKLRQAHGKSTRARIVLHAVGNHAHLGGGEDTHEVASPRNDM